jgi:hypothetical protein
MTWFDTEKSSNEVRALEAQRRRARGVSPERARKASYLTHDMFCPLQFCHLDQGRGSKATEYAWRDPEAACASTLIQGVLPGNSVLNDPSFFHKVSAHAIWGERLESAWQRMRRRDLSTPFSVADAPSDSGRDDKTMDE